MILYRTPYGYTFRDETDGKALFMRYHGNGISDSWMTFSEFYGDDRKPHEQELFDRIGDDMREYTPEKINEMLEELVIDGMITHDEYFLEKI